MAEPAKTIKKTSLKDLDRFNNIKEREGKTDSEAFKLLLDRFYTETPDKTAELQAEIERLQAENKSITDANRLNTEEIQNLQHRCHELQTDNVELINREPEKIEVTKEVPIDLEGNQFIADLTAENFNKARKCRKYFMADQKLMHEDEYANQLINTAVPYYLNRKYDHILDK